MIVITVVIISIIIVVIIIIVYINVELLLYIDCIFKMLTIIDEMMRDDGYIIIISSISETYDGEICIRCIYGLARWKINIFR